MEESHKQLARRVPRLNFRTTAEHQPDDIAFIPQSQDNAGPYESEQCRNLYLGQPAQNMPQRFSA